MANAADNNTLAEMERRIVAGNAPLVAQIQGLRGDLSAFIDLFRGAAAKAKPADAPAPVAEEPPAPGPAFDMETAIKESGQWECSDMHCRDCKADVNAGCLVAYGIFGTQALAVAAVETGAHAPLVVDAVASNGKRTVRLGVIPPVSTVPRNTAPGAGMPSLAAAAVRAGLTTDAAATPPAADDAIPSSAALAEMKRPALVKLAAKLGMKKATLASADVCRTFIEAARAKVDKPDKPKAAKGSKKIKGKKAAKKR